MTPRDKKMAVLRHLSSKSDPTSLPQILSELSDDYKERTVRRWLKELSEEGLVKVIGQRRGTKYLITGKSSAAIRDTKSCFGSNSLSIIEKVRTPLYERLPCAYNDEWFDSYKPNKTFYLSDSIRLKLNEAGNHENKDDPAGTYARQIYNRLLIDLSYNSSRLEGNTYSLLDTEKLLLRGDTPEGKLDEEKVMILNHKEAIRYLVDQAHSLEVSYQTIFTIHYLLSDGLLEPQYSGKVRDHGVRISGSTYIPFDNSSRIERQVHRIAEKAYLIKDPFEQTFFLLIHLSYLQAFADVNKRTARVVANIPLIKANLVPLSFNDIERDDYMSAMIAIYELQQWTPLVDLFVYSYLRTSVAYKNTAKEIGFDEIRVRYRIQRRNIVSKVLSECLVGESMDAVIELEAESKVPEKDLKAFIEDVSEDLSQMDESRLIGLGVTPGQLKKWQESQKT